MSHYTNSDSYQNGYNTGQSNLQNEYYQPQPSHYQQDAQERSRGHLQDAQNQAQPYSQEKYEHPQRHLQQAHHGQEQQYSRDIQEKPGNYNQQKHGQDSAGVGAVGQAITTSGNQGNGVLNDGTGYNGGNGFANDGNSGNGGHGNQAYAVNHGTNANSQGKQPWFNDFFSCCSPFSLCCLTCWVPCCTYGKTSHRMKNGGDMSDYSGCNGRCMLMCCASCVGLHCVPVALQNVTMRERYNLEGGVGGDLVKAFCCPCCSLIQQDKEAKYREELLPGRGTKEQYRPNPGMTYGPN